MKTLFFISFLFVCSMVIGQSSKIIGTPVRVGELEVAEFDFPQKMTYNEAANACAKLLGGGGWRLPTLDELNLIYQYKDEIGGFKDWYYWSCTEASKWAVWAKALSSGYETALDFEDSRFTTPNVRAVRDL
jgi:hypothetical protein